MKLHMRQQLKIYNSLSGEKEIFTPASEDHVGMYVCGPTVYNKVHLGNCRTFISFDLVYRYLKHLGYKVRYVRNITDVGHLEDGQEEDKIAKKARLERLEPMEVVQRYTIDFHYILGKFNVLPPNIEPTATGHIIEQIAMVEKLIDKGLAYESNGSVYFDVAGYNKMRGSDKNRYGKLSGRKAEDMIANTRELNNQQDKRNPQDFALWKKASPDHIMRWSSPWSDGFPGWHLECVAMSTKYLGETFDIHGGGMDLKFPHHECEIAQGYAVNGVDPVRYWMHANMLTLNGKKMAKSTGNNILPEDIFTGNNDILSKAFTPAVLRFFMMQAHYRSVLDFSNDALEAAERGYYRLMHTLAIPLSELKKSDVSDIDIARWRDNCYEAINDDFNSPVLVAQLFEGVRYINAVKDGKERLKEEDIQLLYKTMQDFVYDVLGLEAVAETTNSDTLSGVINTLVRLRDEARADKNWALSDRIRDELTALGIALKDGKDGTIFTIK